MPNLKKSFHGKGVFGWFKVTFVKRYKEEEKGEENGQFSGTHISRTTGLISFKLVCRVVYMEGIKYVNLIEIGIVVIEI